jgi:hypothetical protein
LTNNSKRLWICIIINARHPLPMHLFGVIVRL